MYFHKAVGTVNYVAEVCTHNNRRPHANLTNAMSTQSKWYRGTHYEILSESHGHPIELWSVVMKSGYVYTMQNECRVFQLNSMKFIVCFDGIFLIVRSM